MFERLQRGDVEAVPRFFSRDADVHSIAAGRTVQGRDELAIMLSQLFERERGVEATTFHYDADGRGHVMVSGRLRIRDARGLTDLPAAWVCDVVGDEIVSVHGYTSRAAAERIFQRRRRGRSHLRSAA
jgi:ketosteroid isomerase-like protein